MQDSQLGVYLSNADHSACLDARQSRFADIESLTQSGGAILISSLFSITVKRAVASPPTRCPRPFLMSRLTYFQFLPQAAQLALLRGF